jgi:hypothetical protein
MLRGNIPLAACSSIRFVRPAYSLPALQSTCPLRPVARPGRASTPIHVPRLAKGISFETKLGKKEKPEGAVGVGSVKPTPGVARLQPLLNEEQLSSKEQRKADWGIMKEMARYLWPKVPLLDN